jgi:DNA-binding transcriptional LysR family regulator
MSKIKLNQLEMLVAAADSGSFSAAAADLDCTQSRISHGIAELEQCMEVRLLERSRSGCTPTPAGQRVLAAARQMLRIADEVASSARNEAGVSGDIQLSCLRSASTHLLPHVMEALANRFPGVHVEINDGCSDYREVVNHVEKGLADIGITRGPVGDHLVSQPYVCDDYVVVAPSSMGLKSPACWVELARLPFIHLAQPGSGWIVEQCRAAGLACRPSHRLSNACAILALVSRGLGYALLPRLVAFPDEPGTQILALPFRASRRLVVVARPTMARTSLVSTVIQLILDRRLITETDAWRSGAITFEAQGMSSLRT